MGFIKEFKEFAIKGNVIDLAIGVIMAAAFGKIIAALTESIIMPLISMLFNKPDFKSIGFTLRNTYFPIGIFIQSIIDFTLVALVLFLIIKGINRMNRKKAEPVTEPQAPEYTLQEKLLMEIRDSLRK